MTQIINIDALQEEPPFTLQIGDESHPMKVFSVQDFLSNMKDIEKLGVNPSFSDELDLSIKIIARAFPTLGEERIRQFQVSTIEKLFRISRGEDPNAAPTGSTENPPKAS